MLSQHHFKTSSPIERLAYAGFGLALIGLFIALLSPDSLRAFTHASSTPSFSIGRGWIALTLTYGLLFLSGAMYVFARNRERPAEAMHEGTFQSSAQSRGAWAWIWALVFTTFYALLYWSPSALEGAVRLSDPLSLWLSGKPADSWFLYGALYTAVICVFGLRMILRYQHSRYHLLRTCSLIFFQLGFAFVLPQLLKRMSLPDFYFSYFWPLKPDYLLPFDYIIDPNSGIAAAQWSGYAVGRFMLLWGALMSLVMTPVLTYFYGKRWYCSWVCGCGGLAETLGDPWRHLSDKSQQAWRLERWLIYGGLALIISLTIGLWLNELSGRAWLGDDGASLFWKTYGFIIVMAFSGVIGVGFYPLLGPRIWCRFGCPQAAILGLLQRFFSRFRITTNGGQCISCGQCSTYCEMGIDVRAYAQEGEVIIRASCVGCGVCADVCPRGVLKLESGPTPRR